MKWISHVWLPNQHLQYVLCSRMIAASCAYWPCVIQIHLQHQKKPLRICSWCVSLMLMCFKLLLWPAAHHLSQAIMALAWTPILALFLNLSDEPASVALISANCPPTHTTLCRWIRSWQGLWITHCMLNYQHGKHTHTHTRTEENVRLRHICLASCTNVQSSFLKCDLHFQWRSDRAQELFMLIATCLLIVMRLISPVRMFSLSPLRATRRLPWTCEEKERAIIHAKHTNSTNFLLLTFGLPELL